MMIPCSSGIRGRCVCTEQSKALRSSFLSLILDNYPPFHLLLTLVTCLCHRLFLSPGVSALIHSLLSVCPAGLFLSLQGLAVLPLSVPPSALAGFSLSLSLFSFPPGSDRAVWLSGPSLERARAQRKAFELKHDLAPCLLLHPRWF